MSERKGLYETFHDSSTVKPRLTKKQLIEKLQFSDDDCEIFVLSINPDRQFSIIATEIDGCDKFSFVIDVNERN